MSYKIMVGKYEYTSYTHYQLTSKEKGLKLGDCRVIFGHLFYVSGLFKRTIFSVPEVHWTSVEYNNMEMQGSSYEERKKFLTKLGRQIKGCKEFFYE